MIRTMIRHGVLLALAALTLMIPGAQAQFPGYPPVNSVQIGHGSAQPPGWDFTLGSIASQQSSAVAITGGSITGMASPVVGSDVATKLYVDQSAVGLSPHASVRLTTTAALPSNTYNNGSAGVVATLVATANGALSVDSVAVAVNDRILVKDEVAAVNNGIYVVTTAGGASAAYVLTRASDANTVGTGTSKISTGTYVFTVAGSVQLNTAWVQTASLSAIGVSPMVWNLFSAGAVASLNGLDGPLQIVAGTGINVTTAAPNITIAAQPVVMPYYLGGLTMAVDATTPNTVLDIRGGAAADSSNATTIKAGPFTKSIAGAWAAGSGANGMGQGLSAIANTWYHVCLANNAGTADYWFDTDAICDHRPATITDPLFRRIGSFRTDASSHIVAFLQFGNTFTYSEVTILSFGFGNASGLVAMVGPPGVVTQPIVGGVITCTVSAGSGCAANFTLTTPGTAVFWGYYFPLNFGSSVNLGGQSGGSGQLAPPTNINGQLTYGINTGGGPSISNYSAQMWQQGYIDWRGQAN